MGFAGRDGGGRGRGRGRGLPRGAGNFMIRGGRGGRGGYGENGGGRPDYGSQQHQDYVSIPASKCGLVIGKGGETIKNINQVRSFNSEAGSVLSSFAFRISTLKDYSIRI